MELTQARGNIPEVRKCDFFSFLDWLESVQVENDEFWWCVTVKSGVFNILNPKNGVRRASVIEQTCQQSEDADKLRWTSRSGALEAVFEEAGY